MILERLEKLPVGSFQYKLLAVTGLGWLFDSMDTGLIAFVLPVLAKDWSLTPAQMGWIGSIGLIGMALGAVLAGTLADRIGRKKVFSITVLLYSLSTGMCALSWSYESLLFFRFLEGKDAEKMQTLIDALEDNDDIQNVYSNHEIDED